MIRIVYICGYNSQKPPSTLGLWDFSKKVFFLFDFNRAKMKSFTEMKVYPKNWETSKKSVNKQWVVRYEYTDKSGVIHPKALRGMNHIKDHGERVLYTKFLLKQEQKLLDKGYTPVTEEFEGVTETLILTPSTPFMRANAWITKSSAVSRTY
ncbi:hypothetical protein [Elizabethkingia anophelis]|uniref:hypothetical protein n=1 Tax=Elizabethkingia anophelis TaxID=1117645 RepID=UPI003891AC8B